MGVGLQPLEFTECLADSPQFRDNLQRHEKELERTSQQIKRLIKEVKDVVSAAKRLGAAQLALATSMEQLEFTCIGASMTEDERVISHSLHHFAHLIRTIEEERDRMLGRADDQIIKPLEKFRKEHIGAVKEGKKKFDKKTAKFCQSQERTLSLSTKKPENVFQEADAAMDMAERDFCQASLEYVRQLQGVHERKKFELVETLLGFVFSWWTFHHTAHDVHSDAEPRVRDLQLRIQRTRSNYEEMSKQTESLMKKMMELRQTSKEPEGGDEVSGGVSRSGYLFLMEKKAFGTAWSKQYVTYDKSSKVLTLTPFNQINVKTTLPSESVCVCGARGCSEPPERRFCWECIASGGPGVGPGVGAGPGAVGPGGGPVLTLQALSEPDRAAWLRALDSDPSVANCIDIIAAKTCGLEPGGETCQLDEAGFTFVKTLIAVLEARGLEEQGLYRIAGVASKVSRLVSAATDPRRLPPLTAAGGAEWESKTLTSALKAYLRALPQPLLTTRLHRQFIAAAKLERNERLAAVQALVQALPQQHYDMLRIVVTHLANVAAKSDKNLMTTSNLAVCFGPTLLRAERETVASILEIKFYNVIVETLLEHADAVLRDAATAQRNGITRTSPASVPVTARNDIKCWPAERGGVVSRYSPHHQHLLQQFLPPPLPSPAAPGVALPPPPLLHTVAPPMPPHVAPQALLALRGVGRSSSSSAESVSSASPPPPHSNIHNRNYRYTRVRTLYACLGESEGELSFEPNQIITNVSPSAEPGWLRGSLNGKQGLVPENYVEPLP